jgi:tetratricopeptide (TPR) repeat protein
MRRGLRTALLAAFAACAALFAIPGASAFGEGAPTVARALLDEARQASGIGDWETAAACLETAVSQDPGDADLLYLSALAFVKLGRPYASALGDLDAALRTGRFDYYSRRDASVLKAELLTRERRWKEALDALGRVGAEAAADSAYGLVRARDLAGMGDESAFIAEIGDGLRRFPDESAYARLFLARAGKVPDSKQARAIGDTIIGRLRRYAVADPELPVIAAPLLPDLSSRRDAVLAFRTAGGKSPASTLRALEYGIIDEAAASAEMLSSVYPVALDDLASLLALAGSPAGRDAVGSALAAWSGRVLVDSDSDGVFDANFDISKGLVTAWSRDSGQEGIIDEVASFAEGLPKQFHLSGEVDVDIRYSTYPAVESVAFREKGEVRKYAFGPESLAFAPIAMRPFALSGKSAIYLPYPQARLSLSERACAATALGVEASSGDTREVTVLEKGLPVSSTTYVGGRVLSRRSYEKGRPVIEKVDADGDGRFETERGFAQDADGSWKIAWFRNDIDGDGVFEYSEQTVFPYLKEWDYDGNGSVDARQFELADGSIREEFSSRLDGRLDEAIVVKDGKIVSLARDGLKVDLIPDSNGALTWIGRKAFDLGRNLPEGEGVFFYMGKRYTLIRIGALAFAELIP